MVNYIVWIYIICSKNREYLIIGGGINKFWIKYVLMLMIIFIVGTVD